MHDSLYARARRGELPDVLPHDEIAILATANARSPWGQMKEDGEEAPPVRYRIALETLILCGDLAYTHKEEGLLAYWYDPCVTNEPGDNAPVTGWGTRYYLTREDVKAVYLELGEIGDGLRIWLRLPVAVSKQKRQLSKETIRKDCPEWLRKKLRPLNLLQRIKQGATKTEGRKVVFGVEITAQEIVMALELLEVIPEGKNRRTMSAAVREFYQEEVEDWAARHTAEAGTARALVSWYKAGEALAGEASDAQATTQRQQIKPVP